MTVLTELELEVLRAAEAGESRTAIARRLGVSVPAVSQTLGRARRKGMRIPPPKRPSPATDLARAHFAAGGTPKGLRKMLGCSQQRANDLRRAWEASR